MDNPAIVLMNQAAERAALDEADREFIQQVDEIVRTTIPENQTFEEYSRRVGEPPALTSIRQIMMENVSGDIAPGVEEEREARRIFAEDLARLYHSSQQAVQESLRIPPSFMAREEIGMAVGNPTGIARARFEIGNPNTHFVNGPNRNGDDFSRVMNPRMQELMNAAAEANSEFIRHRLREGGLVRSILPHVPLTPTIVDDMAGGLSRSPAEVQAARRDQQRILRREAIRRETAERVLEEPCFSRDGRDSDLRHISGRRRHIQVEVDG